uniref:Neurobeachin-like protein 2 n=1 Tax=Varanus komodoensis TaxID=61221 RepID=A0A8D2LFF2_VARKO
QPCEVDQESVSEIPLLPRDVLHVLTQQLAHCVPQSARQEVAEAGLGQALLIVKFFIIICRYVSAAPLFRWCFAPSLAALKSTQGQPLPSQSRLENVTLYALHLSECLFDPYQTWRRQLKCFQEGDELPEALQLRLIHLFGAVLSGGKHNALLAVTPSSVEVLMLVLRRWCSPAGGAPRDPRLLQLALKSLVRMVHVLHGSSPGQRKVEIRAIVDCYFKVLNADQPMAARDGPPGPRWEERLVALRVSMLDAIPEMLNCDDRPVLQAFFLSNNCFEHIIRLIQNSKVFSGNSDVIAIHAIGVLTSIMSSSPSAKEVFKERIGYSHLYDVLKSQSQSQPSRMLLQELLNMAVEGDHSSVPPRLIRNEQPLLILIAWIPELQSPDLQVFLSDRLRRICDASLQSRTTCVKAGMVGCLLDALCAAEPRPDPRCSGDLLHLLQVLGGLSIQPGELRQLLQLLRTEPGQGPHPYTVQVVRALSGMARGDTPKRALQYFDLTPGMAGIMVPAIQKWPGGGFAFHAWVCLVEETQDSPEEAPRLKRKQLYSFFTASGTGFEAFFTADGVLVVAVCTKKEYMTVALPEFPFNDAAWVSASRAGPEPGGFPACRAGRCGSLLHSLGVHDIASHPSRFRPGPALLSLQEQAESGPSGRAATSPPSQRSRWGHPHLALHGVRRSHVLLVPGAPESSPASSVTAGPNVASPFKPEGDFLELSNKLLLYYTPQACKNNICLDLSSNHFFDGRLTGHKRVNWDIKDVVNCVGGMGVLLPLLDQLASQKKASEDQPETHDLSRLERNGVAAFLLLVKNFLRGHPVNQESLVQCQGPAIIGALLQKVPSQAMDMNVLMASQILMEQVASEGHSLLLHLLYQYLLFDFRIWSNSDFAVRLGHIQYLSNVIKDHKQRIRKKYGVQYILDSIRTYYGSCKEKPVATDDIRTVQTSLFSLIKDFFCRSFSTDEMQSTLNYLAAVNDEHQVRLGRVIHSLQKSSPSQEQVYTFLFELGNVEILFSLLVQRKFSDEVRERVFKILYKLLKYEKVNERSKHRLKLKDIGYQGFISFLNDVPVSMLLFRCLLEQVLGSGEAPALGCARRGCLRHLLFHLIYSQSDVVKQLARLAGWQDTLTKLYVKESYESRQHSLSGSANGTGCPPDLLRSANPPGAEAGREPPDVASPSACDPPDLDVFLPLGYEGSDHELSEGFSDHSVSPTGQRSRPFHPDGAFKSFDSLELASHGSSSNMDIPGQGEGRAGEALSTAESGNQTPVSLPGTPSPLENFKKAARFSPAQPLALWSLKDRDVWRDEKPGQRLSGRRGLCHIPLDPTLFPQQTPEEELCNLLTNIVFSVTWRGVEGWDDAAWKERGQVFSVLTKLGSACELVRPPDEIKRSLLEEMLESALTDLKDPTPAMLPGLTQNALKLLRLLQDFLFAEGHNNQALWSEKVYEGVNSLLDKLGVWYHLANGTSDLKEMAHIGLRVLIGYIMIEDLQALAYVKLHSLLQTASALRKGEACYLLGKLEAPLRRSLHAKSEAFSCLVPVIRTLMDRCYDALQLQHFLPSLPPTNGSPTFYEDFQGFCTTPEWMAFIEKHVQPAMAQFELDTFAKSHDHMSSFWNSCYDALMSSSQRREKEKADSRRNFQRLVLEPVMKRTKLENIRHTNMLKQVNNHHTTVLKQWRALRCLLTSPRSAWADRYMHWKLSGAETYSRMRLKLVPNYNFDRHVEASALRDNLGKERLPLPSLNVPGKPVSELQDDQLAEEDLSFLDKQSQREKLVISEDCELITIVAVIPGRLEVTTQHIYFYDGSIGYDFKRPLSQLRELHLCRYNLRRSALEFFFIDQANYFLNFKKMVRNKVYSSILSLRPPNQIYFASRSPQELLKASGLTQKWVQREISNFEYLMQLNTIAGRTYNDLSQYPVFPWILQDYVSETLDLSDPALFRDLSKPIGVANGRHAKEVKEKYESFEDPNGTIDKFHYGTHYSNAAGVMHYLIRTEPFTTLHVQLQSGRFDCSDRQFHSIPTAWQACMENPVDVKELIPEFFYFPEFLENQNGFDLGSLQMSNEKVGDVILPRWAKSPEDFIHKHRQALESEYVSAHLHEWIDLIFGYKQRGPAAVEALNVFHYCTYEGAVDLDAIADETQRKALEGFISNFGQTPCQLLKEPHPARLSAENASRRLSRLDTASPSIFENLGQLKSFFVEGISDGIPLVQAVVPKNQAHSFMTQGSPDVLVTVSANGLLGTHGWLPYDKNISNYFSFTKDSTVSNAKTQRYLYGPFAPGVDVSSKTLAVSHDGKLLFSGGHWDNSLRVTALGKGKVVAHINRHNDVVTCLALDLCGIYLISGSRDTTSMVWQVLQQGGFSCGLAPKPVQVLYGHDDEVTCVAISTELDMAVSGSKDGTIIVHTIRRGQFMRSLKPPCESSLPVTISNLAVGHEGQIVVQTTVEGRASLKDKFALHRYSINGKHLASAPLEEQVSSLCVTEDFVVLGTAQCSLQIRDLQSLQAAVAPLAMKVPIHSVSVTKEKSHILVGLEDGKLIVVGAGQPSEVRTGQFHRRLWRSTRRISQVSSGETEYNPAEPK